MTSTSEPGPAAAYHYYRKPGALPLLGDLLHGLRDHLGLLDACMRTGADLVEFDMCVRSAFALLHPGAVRQIFVEDNDWFVRAGNLETAAIAALLGRGVLTTDGEAWLAYKRMNAPAFARAAVDTMQGLIDDSIDRTIDEWRATGGQQRRLFDDFLALAVTATTTGFLSQRPDEHEQATLVDALLTGPGLIMDMVRSRAFWLLRAPLPRVRRFRRTVAAVEHMLARNVERRRALGSRAPADLLDMVLQYRHAGTGAGFTPAEVRDQLVTAVIAAPENIATTLSWASYALQTNPAVLANLRASLGRGEHEYLRAVIDETLRCYAATPMIDRVAARDVQIGAVRIPRGSLVIVPILALHHDPRFWDAPAEFRPERFLGETPRAFFPFGHGPRKCIGERLGRAVLESALARFVTTFEWSRPTPAPPGFAPMVNLRPGDHMLMWREVRRSAAA